MTTKLRVGVVCLAAGLALLTYSARAGTVTYDFTTDETLGLDIRGADGTGIPMAVPRWQSKGGNPETGGFLVLTHAVNYFNTHVMFPNLDPGNVVTSFHFECDLRVGNSQGDRGADGFSINFARSYDTVIAQWDDAEAGRGYRGDTSSGPCTGCESISLPETGTRTGIAISFDTWQGNTYNDGTDIEGIMVAVDGVTLPGTDPRGTPLLTRHGTCSDNTSLQTGPRDPAFWADEWTVDPLLVYATNAWDTLCWQHFLVDLDETSKLTVVWKGRTLLDKYQTTYFPTAGRLIFGGRTGGANEQTHVDNIVLTTVAVPAESEAPTDPTNLRAVQVGARRVALQWDPSVERPDPQARLAYEVSRNGVVIAAVVTDTNYVDAPGPDRDSWYQLAPSTAYTYSVLARDLNENSSGSVTLAVTTAAEVPVPGYFTGQVYTNVTGTQIDTFAGWPGTDPNFPGSPGKVGWWLSGMSFNQPSGAWGDNYGFRFTGTLTPPKNGNYRFFVRSDDASQFFLNATGAAIPDPSSAYPIAQEDDCCDAFAEPGQAENVDAAGVGTGTFPTSAAIPLTAGTKYGFLWLVKEGGGGDWGQVAWRVEGDTTPAANLPPIGGLYVEPTTGGAVSDPGGASAAITQEPQDMTAGANAHLNLWVATATTSPWGYGAVYQWYKDGVAIMNAARTNLYFDVLAPADAGLYKVFVTVPGASTTSREATLTVTNDLTLPTIDVSGVHGSQDLTHLTVVFSEPVTSPTATTAGNYTMEPALAVSAATRVDQYTILLTTATQAPATKYTLTVNNVQDNAGLSIAANTKVDWMSWVVVGTVGPVTAEIYDGCGGCTAGTIPNTAVTNLTLGYANYPASPDNTTNITAFNTRLYYPDDTHETFGARMTGLITPTESGNYRFFTTSDDASEVWLSTDTSEANLVKIAEETGCCNAFTEPNSARTSAPKALVGGTSYLLRGIYKEGGGGDYMQIAWRKEGNPFPASSLQPIPGTFDPWAGVPYVTTQPMGAAVALGASATFTVAAELGLRPVSYQWQRLEAKTTWVNIDGATAATLTITDVDLSKITGYRVRVSNSAGSVNSRGVVLTLANSFIIEAEDFDYTNGLHLAVADTMPYTGFAYDGLSATYDVDYHNDNNDSITYRRGGDLAVAGHGASMDNATGNLLSLQRGAWDMVNNYKIGWIGTGDWHNFTRAVPAGTYTAVAALSYGNTDDHALKAKLSKVTAGVGTTTQTLEDLGFFDQSGSGGWGQNNLVPMKDASGTTTAVFTVADAVTTLRMSHDSGDFDWFMLVPTEGVTPPPQITEIKVNAGGTITVTWTGGGVLEATESLTAPDWQTVAAASPATLTPPAGTKTLFGRVRQ